MAASNSTTNYSLPIYLAADKTDWLSTFNGAMNTIDGAMHDNATAAATNGAAISALTTRVDNINQTTTAQASATVSPETWTTVIEYEPTTPGTYMVKATGMFQSNSGGTMRAVWVGTDSAGGTINSRFQTQTAPPVSGYVTHVSVVHFIKVLSGEKIYVRAFHNSTVSLTCNGGLEISEMHL